MEIRAYAGRRMPCTKVEGTENSDCKTFHFEIQVPWEAQSEGRRPRTWWLHCPLALLSVARELGGIGLSARSKQGWLGMLESGILGFSRRLCVCVCVCVYEGVFLFATQSRLAGCGSLCLLA